jgi:septum formation protein
MRRLILASASPRRKELLKGIGIDCEVIVSDVPEVWEAGLSPAGIARKLARDKAEAVAKTLPNGIVIGADTVVVLEGEVLGKPQDPTDAFRMLRALSGKVHEVMTAVAVIDIDQGSLQEAGATTHVHFRQLSDPEIEAYIATGEPMDKAGAYGIQGKGILFVEGIEGCYTNVVGLPLPKLAEILAGMGLSIF